MTRPGSAVPAVVGHRPLYARMLRLRFLTPSGFLCFVFLEGAVALGILLALAELVSWWGVLVLPATVAIMVKLNDVIAGSLTPPAPVARLAGAGAAGASAAGASAGGVAAGGAVFAEHASPSLRPARETTFPRDGVGDQATIRLPAVVDRGPAVPIKHSWPERAEAQQQWLRQSATRRYE